MKLQSRSSGRVLAPQCATSAEGGRYVGDLVRCGAVRKMKDLWPFGVALRGEASNHLMLRWLKTVVVSDEEKAHVDASGGEQEGERERTADDVSKQNRWHQNRGNCSCSGMSLAGARLLARRCPAWRRREPGLRLLARNVGRRVPILRARLAGRAARGRAPSGRNREALSTVAARWRTGS